MNVSKYSRVGYGVLERYDQGQVTNLARPSQAAVHSPFDWLTAPLLA